MLKKKNRQKNAKRYEIHKKDRKRVGKLIAAARKYSREEFEQKIEIKSKENPKQLLWTCFVKSTDNKQNKQHGRRRK